ncbi:unnamed protein product [Closterium sp. NIES-65]|nr:unnamed protein product [Closterium sp. NIES-65]
MGPTDLDCGPAALICGPTALTCGPAAFNCGPADFTYGPAALVGGPAALTCGPAALTCSPAALTGGPVTCCSAARHPGCPTRPTQPSSRPPRRPAAASPNRPGNRAAGQPSRRAARQPSSRAALQPSRPATEPPCRRAAQQSSRRAAEPHCSRAAQPPNSRAAELPSRPTAEPPELPCLVSTVPLLLHFPHPTVALLVYCDDLQLFLQCDRAAPDADATVRSQWATRDAAARLPVRRHLPTSERAHFSQYKSAQTLYDAVVARYSSLATAALSRLMLPYLFPDLAAFPTVADLITHLRTSDTRYRAALPAEGVLPPPSCPLLPLVLRSTSLVLSRSALRLPLRESAAQARARGARVLEEPVGAVEAAVEVAEGVGVVVGVVAGVGVSVAAVEAEAEAVVAEGAESAVVAEAAAVAEATEVAVEQVAVLHRG